MRTYILRRLLLMIPTFLGITFVTFIVTHFVPGGPIDQLLSRAVQMSGEVGGGVSHGPSAPNYQLTEDELLIIKKFYGFDQPVLVRYKNWLWNILHFNLGESYRYLTPVSQMIAEKLPVSTYFGLLTTLLVYLICIPLGVLKAVWHQSRFDHATSALIFIGYAIPSFAFGMFLLVIFASHLDWFPLGEFVSSGFDQLSFFGKIKDLVSHTFLPLLAYLIGSFALMTMLMKNAVLEQMSSEYVKTAFAKGATQHRAVFYHAFRNALIPLATGFGHNISVFLMGSFMIEKIFNLDGIGLLGYQAVVERDYPVVLGMLVISSLLLLFGNLLSDLCVAFVDPRVRFH